jgi:hypothetical protein
MINIKIHESMTIYISRLPDVWRHETPLVTTFSVNQKPTSFFFRQNCDTRIIVGLLHSPHCYLASYIVANKHTATCKVVDKLDPLLSLHYLGHFTLPWSLHNNLSDVTRRTQCFCVKKPLCSYVWPPRHRRSPVLIQTFQAWQWVKYGNLSEVELNRWDTTLLRRPATLRHCSSTHCNPHRK